MNIDQILAETAELAGDTDRFSVIDVDTDKVEIALANALVESSQKTDSVALAAGTFAALYDDLGQELQEELKKQRLLAAATVKTARKISEIMGRGLEATLASLDEITKQYGHKPKKRRMDDQSAGSQDGAQAPEG